MRSISKTTALWLTASAAALGSTAANAQQGASGRDEIIVTAQGREQSLQDVPVSVSVVSGEQLEDFNITNLTDLAARLPNVNIAEAPSSALNIRGVGSGTGNWGFQQSVGTFVDGIYRSRAHSIRAALFDVDRIEVLKGPQTTFFGANSIAGALNITTRGPSDELEANGSALYGSHGEYNTELGVSAPLTDTLSFRLAGQISGMDGYIETPTGDAPNRDSWQVRGSLRFEPTDRLTSQLRVDHGSSDAIGNLAFQVVGCPPPAPADIVGDGCADFLAQNGGVIDDELDYHSDTPLDYAYFDFTEIAWTNTLEVFDGHQLILRTGYYDHDSQQQFTGIPYPITSGPAGTTDGLPVRTQELYDQFSQEIRFQSDEGGFIDYMVGGYYAKDEMNFTNNVGFFFADFGLLTQLVSFGVIPTSPLPVPVLTNQALPGDHVSAQLSNDAENETISAFGAVTIRPIDRVRINLGARWSRIEKFATRASTRGVSDNLRPGTYVEYNEDTQLLLNSLLLGSAEDFGGGSMPGRRTDKDFMPSASIQVDATDNVMVYASYAEGFKAGGYSTANFPVTFEPEYVDAYEAGIKASFFNGDLDANLAVFLNDYQNLQESVVQTLLVDIGGGNFVGTTNSIIDNVASSEAKGVEFDFGLRINDYITLNGAVAYLKSEYDEYVGAPCNEVQLATQAVDAMGTPLFTGGPMPSPVTVCDQMGGTQDLSGQQRAFAPEWSGNLSAHVEIPLDNGLNFTLDPVVYFKDDHFLSATADPTASQDAYAKVDLRVGIAAAEGRWSLALIGRNLTNEVTASYAAPVTGATGSQRYMVERPRSFAAQLSFNY